tara:strand:- start:545 stop:1342 length:798 start_codon:yes stop_codon:yes gene_type:complete
MINAYNGELVLGHVGGDDDDKIYFYQWDNDSHGFEKPDSLSIWESKDIDFGSPGSNKKVYKIYVTYKSTGHSGITMKYSTNGNAAVNTFDPTSSTNYTDKIFQNTFNGVRTEWKVAELKPSSSINNIKSIQLKLFPHPGDTFEDGADNIFTGECQANSGDITQSSTIVRLASTASTSDDHYNNYCIGIYDGNARFNVSRVSDYDAVTDGGITKKLTVSPAFADKNYGTTTAQAGDATDSFYYIGCVSNDFQINDITIVYRPKRIK